MTINVDAVYDGTALLPQEAVALIPNHHYLVTIVDIDAEESPNVESAVSLLRSIAGFYDTPKAWSALHDHDRVGGATAPTTGTPNTAGA